MNKNYTKWFVEITNQEYDGSLANMSIAIDDFQFVMASRGIFSFEELGIDNIMEENNG